MYIYYMCYYVTFIYAYVCVSKVHISLSLYICAVFQNKNHALNYTEFRNI